MAIRPVPYQIPDYDPLPQAAANSEKSQGLVLITGSGQRQIYYYGCLHQQNQQRKMLPHYYAGGSHRVIHQHQRSMSINEIGSDNSVPGGALKAASSGS